ncbi:hypothetical protein RHMOL_Rhmol02G0278300 [Rhododendron molle]|uniref:Uncharacterized protein n=1 Tax=Rhododendron molle TaxID=49168 RepID=A0ACC0PW97_RHOML|nr:hypothetical protein RHMOL_Rhmol02G0278300 [Rhododendron molle]
MTNFFSDNTPDFSRLDLKVMPTPATFEALSTMRSCSSSSKLHTPTIKDRLRSFLTYSSNYISKHALLDPNWDTSGGVPPQSITVHAGNPPQLTDAHKRPSSSMSCCCPFLVNTSGNAANSARKLVDSMLTTPVTARSGKEKE